MLNVVVLPAPLGPMTPTISHSPTEMLTSRAAWTPPKRIEQPLVSSTDIGDLHLLLAAVVDVEAVAAQPAEDGPDLLADAARVHRQRQEEQQRPEDQRRDLGGERRRERDLLEGHGDDVELLDDEPEEGEERRPDDHAGAAPEATDDRHDHEDEGEPEVVDVGHDERVVVGEQRTAEPGEQAGHDEGEEREHLDVHTERRGDPRVL